MHLEEKKTLVQTKETCTGKGVNVYIHFVMMWQEKI